MTYGYKYNHAGVREQKRLLTSPHGDDGFGSGPDYKILAHNWEYYMTGAFGEEIVQYKGFQTSSGLGYGNGRKVFLGAHRYRVSGELLLHIDDSKEVNFTDNNGSVRLVVRQNGTAFDTLHFDYKPFGDTLWTSSGNMNRDNFDGSTYDSESDLQMLGFRMYDNETGRFTTPDLLWSAFPAQTPYHYAYNSPLTYRDPTGLAPEKEKEGEELMGWETNWAELYPLYAALYEESERRSNQGMTNADGSLMVNLIEESGGKGSSRYKPDRTGCASGAANGQGDIGGDRKVSKPAQDPGYFDLGISVDRWNNMNEKQQYAALSEANAYLWQLYLGSGADEYSRPEWIYTIFAVTKVDGSTSIVVTNFKTDGFLRSVKGNYNFPCDHPAASDVMYADFYGNVHTHPSNSDHTGRDLARLYVDACGYYSDIPQKGIISGVVTSKTVYYLKIINSENFKSEFDRARNEALRNNLDFGRAYHRWYDAINGGRINAGVIGLQFYDSNNHLGFDRRRR